MQKQRIKTFGTVQRRTFEAKKYPKGSPTRKALNDNALTSEYVPSEKYLYTKVDGKGHLILSASFRTKKQAEAFKEDIMNRVE